MLLLASLFFALFACQSQDKGSYQLNADAFEKGIQQTGIQLLDVRSAGEYKNGHLKNALQADWNNAAQFADRTQHLDKQKPIYIYCLSGGRSAAAARQLRDQGYQVYELTGGINAWKNAGKALEGSSNEPQMQLNQYQEGINSAGVVLVDFGASWCPPCKRMEPVLDELVKEKGNQFRLFKVDGGKDTDVMKSQNVDALPVFIIYKNGKEVWRHQGIVSKEELLKNL